ncbi:MAG: FecR domain-containing protein [Bacteroidota bacterium]
MDKKEFFALLEKYNSGECNPAEEEALLQFYNRLQSRGVMQNWKVSEKEEAKLRLLKRILATTRNEKSGSTRTLVFPKIARIAALFIGLLGLAYILLQNLQTEPLPVPKNAITLELEDGSIEILQEGGSTTVVNQQGRTVGKQQNGQLVYARQPKADKLRYNTLKVPYGKKFNIQLSDGTLVHMNSGSALTYPIQFQTGQSRRITLQGEAFFKVQRDTGRPFVVNTKAMDIQVLGTQFNVAAYAEDQKTQVVLTEGSVALRADSQGQEEKIILKPGFMGTLDKTKRSLSARKVNTALYTSWLNGNLIFRNAPFKNIILKLERRYNVKIENRNRELDEVTFNTNIDVQGETIEQALQLFSNLYAFTYEIQGKTIIIKP